MKIVNHPRRPCVLGFLFILTVLFITACSNNQANSKTVLSDSSLERNNTPSPINMDGFYASDSYSLPSKLAQKGVQYDEMVKMNASPEWKTVQFSFFSFQIPYSSQWTIDGKQVLPISTDEPGNDPPFKGFSFGKYVGHTSAFIREYSLDFKYNWNNDGKLLSQERSENDCPDVKDKNGNLLTLPPKKVTIGNITGISYLVGGAAGCSTQFDFTLGDYSITLSKLYPMGSDDFSHSITPDMEQIIKGIKILEQ